MVFQHFGNWVILTMLSAFILALHIVLQKKVLRRGHASEYLTTFSIVSWVLILPFIGQIDFGMSARTWTMLVIKSILASVSWILITKAYKHMEISTVEPLKNVNAVFLVIFAIPLLGERLEMQQFFGIGLILFGGYLLETFLHPMLINHPLMLFKGKYTHYILFAAVIGGGSGISH